MKYTVTEAYLFFVSDRDWKVEKEFVTSLERLKNDRNGNPRYKIIVTEIYNGHATGSFIFDKVCSYKGREELAADITCDLYKAKTDLDAYHCKVRL